MAKQSLQDRFADYLIARGCHEIVPSPSRKYRCFQKPAAFHDDASPRSYYWLGDSGAVRVGRTSSGSVSITDRARKWLAEQTYEVFDNGRLVEGFTVQANTLGEALKKAIQARPELESRCQVKLAKTAATKLEAKPECEDSPDGRHHFTADLEYDSSGSSMNCEHCGSPQE